MFGNIALICDTLYMVLSSIHFRAERYQPRFSRSMSGYWFVAVILDYNAKNVWGIWNN